MSSIFTPTFYVSIFSSIGLVLSEILPLLPIKSNGILHSLIILFQKNTQESQNVSSKIHQTLDEYEKEIKNVKERRNQSIIVSSGVAESPRSDDTTELNVNEIEDVKQKLNNIVNRLQKLQRDLNDV
jgi:hypothetical protein